jgi:hypothetical protein
MKEDKVVHKRLRRNLEGAEKTCFCSSVGAQGFSPAKNGSKYIGALAPGLLSLVRMRRFQHLFSLGSPSSHLSLSKRHSSMRLSFDYSPRSLICLFKQFIINNLQNNFRNSPAKIACQVQKPINLTKQSR